MATKHERNYVLVNALTKGGSATGGQLRVGYIDKADAQGVPAAWLNNVVVTVLLDEAEQDVGCIVAYLTTDSVWSDDNIITARATTGPGGTVNLTAKRSIYKDENEVTGSGGRIHVWIEIADYVYTEDYRVITETWGKRHEYTEVP